MNKNKCQTGVKSILYLGQIISSEGVKFDPGKIEANAKMPLQNSLNKLMHDHIFRKIHGESRRSNLFPSLLKLNLNSRNSS